MNRQSAWFPRAACLAGLLSCTSALEKPAAPAAARADIEAAMQRYQVAARSVNPDSVSAFYTTTATLFEPSIPPIVSRDSIRAFMASFPGVRVEIATATADTVELHGDMALYWGSYFEKLDFPGQPVSEQHGKFVAQWVRQADGSWLIERMYRIPLPAPGGAQPAGP
jgi:ketosteroid isomerase-like protein